MMTMRRPVIVVAVVIAIAAALTAAGALAATTTSAVYTPGTAGGATPVLDRRVIGYSVEHRPIIAYRLGDPHARRTVVLLGQMHGDEHAGVVVTRSIIDGSRSVEGINLWIIPSMNPDGDAAHTRQNAHGVDLNRNWPDIWAHLSGQYYSGPHPLSEPESRAMYRFLRQVRPALMVSVHQPLDGVDATAGHGAAYQRFITALARNLGLGLKDFRCWSICHGSMAGWYESHHVGIALETVEFGWTPSHAYLVGRAPRGIIAALGGHFGSLAAHDAQLAVSARAGRRVVLFTGRARDPDDPAAQLRYWIRESGRVVARGTAAAAKHSGHGIERHGIDQHLIATPGPHTYCIQVQGVDAGTGDPQRCVAVLIRS